MDDLWAQALQAHQEGDLVTAFQRCNALLDRQPGHFGALNLLGAVALGLDQPAEALIFLDHALRLLPNEPSALVNRGAALHRLGEHEQAVSAYRDAVASCPGYAHGWYNLGTALKELGRLEEALVCLERCVEEDPEYKAGHFNRANTLHDLRQYAPAVLAYDRTIELDPQDAEARKNRAFARLMLGDFTGGLQDFEWRWRTPPLNQAWQDRGCPQWDGSQSLNQKTILVHAEQGLGDTLQFCRLLRQVKALGAAQVVFEVQKPLVPILQGLEGADIVIPQGLPLPRYDFHIPLMSLLLSLGITPDNIPGHTPYLNAPKVDLQRWASDLPRHTFNIGICWQGSAKGSEVGRGIPLQAFASLAAIHNVRLFSLQKATPSEPLSSPRSVWDELQLHDFGPSFDQVMPFGDTAAVMTRLQLVVTTDTSVAHLAGALGVPVWTALPFVCDWRWGPNAENTPWYPTMRLFRQHRRGDWSGCFADIAHALQEALGAEAH